MSPISRLPLLKPPWVEDGSFSLTPSISTTVCWVSAPRMLRLVAVPGPPLRVKLTPGVWASSSVTEMAWLASIAACVRTVTDAPTFSIGWAVRVAVTISSATPLAPTAPATSASGAFCSSAMAEPATRRVASAVELKNVRIMFQSSQLNDPHG